MEESKNSIHAKICAIGTYRLKPEICYRVVKEALELGCNHVDTAALYGNEAAVQQAILDSPMPRPYVTTKLHWDDIEKGRDGILEAVTKTLQRINPIDMLLLHVPTENYQEAWDCMVQDVVGRDKVKNVGVSNFNTHHLEVLDVQPSCNQIEMSPFLPQTITRAYCHANDIQVTAHSPLAKGKLFREESVVRQALRYRKSPAQVMLNWIVHNDALPLPRTSRWEHLIENLDYRFPMRVADLGPWSDKPFVTHPKFTY
jgi:diketogulonate reductase-like aldo/keto reductase